MILFSENLINTYPFIAFIISIGILIIPIYSFRKNISFISFLAIFIFVPFSLTLAIKNIFKYIPGEQIGEIDGWLSFLGGYIGSFITLGGIWWQLKNTRNEKLNEKNENEILAVLSTLTLIQVTADNFFDISETFLKNFLTSGETKFKDSIFLYNKDLLSSFIKNTSYIYNKYLMKSFLVFDSFNLLETTIISNNQSEKIFKETFHCEQLEIFFFLKFEIDSFLSEYSKNYPSEKILIEFLEKLESKIGVINEKYPSYYEQKDEVFIKTLLDNYDNSIQEEDLWLNFLKRLVVLLPLF